MNTHVSSKHAGLKIRLIAFLMDIIIALFPVGIAVILLLHVFKPSQIGSFLIVILFPVLSLIIYFWICSKNSQTFGKKYMGIITLDKYKMNLTSAKALIRSILKVFFWFISWINVPGSEKKLAFHDLLLKTSVFYINDNEIFESDTKERREKFLKRAAFFFPVLSVVIFFVLILSKVKFDFLTSKANTGLIVYSIYLLIPFALFITAFGLTLSIQAKKQKLLKSIFANINIFINSILFAFYVFIIIRTIIIM